MEFQETNYDMPSPKEMKEAISENVKKIIESIDVYDANLLKEKAISFVPFAIEDAYHFTSKSVNTNAKGAVRISLAKEPEGESPYVTAKDEILSKKSRIVSLDYTTGARSYPHVSLLNLFISGYLFKLPIVDGDFNIQGLTKTENTKAKKKYATAVEKFIGYIVSPEMNLNIEAKIKALYNNSPFNVEESNLKYHLKHFPSAHFIMKFLLADGLFEKAINAEIKTCLSSSRELGVNEVDPHLKQLLLPEDGKTKESYVSLSPLHSVPFNEVWTNEMWKMCVAFGKNGNEKDITDILSTAGIDYESLSENGKGNLRLNVRIMSLPIGGTKSLNASAISKYSGLGMSFVNSPPFSDDNKKRLFKLSKNGFYINRDMKLILSKFKDKLSIDYIKDSSGDAFKKIALPNIKYIVSEMNAFTSSVSNSLEVAGLNEYEENDYSHMSWNPKERSSGWYNKVASMICDHLKGESVSSEAMEYIKKQLVLELKL